MRVNGVNAPRRARDGRSGGGGAVRAVPPADPLPLAPQETYKLPHRLIEKKRRDRINECIAQLKDLLPEHLKLTVGASGGTGQRLPRGRFTAGLGWFCFFLFYCLLFLLRDAARPGRL